MPRFVKRFVLQRDTKVTPTTSWQIIKKVYPLFKKGKSHYHACIIISDSHLLLVEAPRYFIAGRPKAALLFWFFGGFRCGVPLFIIMLVIY